MHCILGIAAGCDLLRMFPLRPGMHLRGLRIATSDDSCFIPQLRLRPVTVPPAQTTDEGPTYNRSNAPATHSSVTPFAVANTSPSCTSSSYVFIELGLGSVSECPQLAQFCSTTVLTKQETRQARPSKKSNAVWAETLLCMMEDSIKEACRLYRHRSSAEFRIARVNVPNLTVQSF